MKLIISLLGLLIFSTAVFSQKPLTNSRKNSYYTYIYPLKDEHVKLLYQSKDRRMTDYVLTNPIDSFLTDRPRELRLKPGYYLQVRAVENQLEYKLVENKTASLLLLSNTESEQFILMNKNGEELKDLPVYMGRHRISYDPERQLYHTRKAGRHVLLRVNYEGINNFYRISQPRTSLPSGSWRKVKNTFLRLKDIFKKDKPRYHYNIPENPGYMVFNKPVYRPGDTIKFKAFILARGPGKPVTDKELLIRLKDDMWDNGKIIGRVSAYRPGAFEYQFKLTDSLDLDLDDDYILSLEPLSSAKYDLDKYEGDLGDREYLLKRTVYQSKSFHFEDYELKANHFAVRTDKDVHTPGAPVSIYFKATDENDLNVQDGRVELTLTTNHIPDFNDPYTFVPDTLWNHTIALEPTGETKLVLPDSIFPGPEIQFKAEAVFRNSNNEMHVQSRYLSFSPAEYEITGELTKDTLAVSHRYRGKETPVRAHLFVVNTTGDTISAKEVSLPLTEKVAQNDYKYVIRTGKLTKAFLINSFPAELSPSAYRDRDSVFIQVSNPRRLDFWYTVFAGKKIIEKGRSGTLRHARAFSQKTNVSVVFDYIWGGEPRHEEVNVPFQDKLLNIQTEQPLTIYPGQQVTINVHVKDAAGKPVENADISAYSFTKKFEGGQAPFVPYLGKAYPYRKVQAPFTINLPKSNGAWLLNWGRWSQEMGLDSIRYYQFTHTPNIFRVEEPAPDSITQIAPFVVNKGRIIPVHILYIDEKPVYFSQTTHLQRYSFRVNPGSHKVSFRTRDFSVTLDSVKVSKGNKCILSVNLDQRQNIQAHFIKQKPILSQDEARLINKYLLTVTDNFNGAFATIEQGDNIFLLNPASRNGNYGYSRAPILTGPHSGFTAKFDLKGDKPVYFDPEPDYRFEFRPGLLKQTSLPRFTEFPFSTSLNDFTPRTNNDYTQYPLTTKEVDSMWQDYLDLRSRTTSLFQNENPDDRNTGKLVVKIDSLPDKTFPFVKNIIVYKYDDPDFIRIYPGNTTNLQRFAASKYRIFYLLKGNSYMLQENLKIREYGTNLYRTIGLPVLKRDSVSLKIAGIIENYSNDRNQKGTSHTVQTIKETFNEKYFDSSKLTGEMSGTVYDRGDESPLPGVSVRVKGMKTGVVTDINGNFSIRVPQSGKLVIQFIGYETEEVSIRQGAAMRIKLTPASNALQEIVVVGYGARDKRTLTSAIALTGAVQGVAAGVQIRGTTSMPPAKPLVVIDGVPFDGSIESLDPSVIGEIAILKDAAATAIYGARAANGVILVSTKKKATGETPQSPGADGADQQQSFRKNFSDYAFWQPALKTNEQGNASFTVTFPDDITNWRTFFVGMTGNKQSGAAEGQIKSFRPLSASFTSPLFAVKGDKFQPIGKLMNYTTDTVALKRKFTYNGTMLEDSPLTLLNSRIDTFGLEATGKDSLHFEYSIHRENGYFDGEKRAIPLFEKGVMETKGIFKSLERDTALTLSFDPQLKKVTFRAEASLLPVLLSETKRLREYEYLCNEQLASKLKALLAEKKIRTYLNEPFKYEKNIRDLIKKLEEGRQQNGIWGWWKDSREELWISLHATEALLQAESQGYKTNLDKQKMIGYLIYETDRLKGTDKLFAIETLQHLGAKADFKALFSAYQKEALPEKKPSQYEKMQAILTALHAGLPVRTDSILAARRYTMFGNVYWGDPGYRFFDNSVQLTILAYKILKEEGKHPQLLEKIRNYFLEQRKDGQWRNTYESALILEAILPDILKQGTQPQPASLTLSGAKNETVTSFPYETTLDPESAFTISKKGDFPVYITAYQQFFNSDTQKVSNDFTVNTSFIKRGDKITALKAGEPVILKVNVTARADADYVMIEVPIPAGCSYESKHQASYSSGEVHREHFKNKVSIFCSKLKQGSYQYDIRLIPRYSGTYTLNPAKAEMMYFPVFFGREEMKQVVIK